MSDPLSPGSIRLTEPHDGADRGTRIEELLLAGLDHYFAGHYERAISIWTRIVFLDRHHDRARAYIERARSALAERQRKSEELLHHGVAAYQAGEVDKARDLLVRAAEQGSDAADVFLDRLSRMNNAAAITAARPAAPPAQSPLRRPQAAAPQRHRWTAAAFGVFAVAALMLLGGLPIGTWLSELQAPAVSQPVRPVADEPLPIVRASEAALTRARALYAGGRLHDALQALERISIADPLRLDADRLQADIQRDLLAAAGVSINHPSGGDAGR